MQIDDLNYECKCKSGTIRLSHVQRAIFENPYTPPIGVSRVLKCVMFWGYNKNSLHLPITDWTFVVLELGINVSLLLTVQRRSTGVLVPYVHTRIL